jgi:hypothetical protein
MQAIPQAQPTTMAALTSSAGTGESSTFFYVKWFMVVVILGYLVYVLRPYFSMFMKIVELIRKFLMKAFNKKDDVEPLDVGSKLAENKQEKKPAEANEGYCYMGEKDNVRQCARVDKSSCSGNFYSTESQCVNPS